MGTLPARALLVALPLILAGPIEPPRRPVVAAAADLQFALTDIAAAFGRDHRERVELVFGSSGILARQIRDGAPFEVFLSADEALVESLAADGLTRDRGALYAIGRIVLFAPAGSPLDAHEGLDGLARLLEEGRMGRFAIANPAHAPYGRAAEAALRTRGLWEALQPHLVLGESASQAAQFATAGHAAGGIVPYSLALAPAIAARGAFVLVAETDHPPLRQRMVLLNRAGDTAGRFFTYLQEPAARAVLERFGFVLPRAAGAPR